MLFSAWQWIFARNFHVKIPAHLNLCKKGQSPDTRFCHLPIIVLVFSKAIELLTPKSSRKVDIFSDANLKFHHRYCTRAKSALFDDSKELISFLLRNTSIEVLLKFYQHCMHCISQSKVKIRKVKWQQVLNTCIQFRGKCFGFQF